MRAHLGVHLGNFPSRLHDSTILRILVLICVRRPKCRHCEISSSGQITIKSRAEKNRWWWTLIYTECRRFMLSISVTELD